MTGAAGCSYTTHLNDTGSGLLDRLSLGGKDKETSAEMRLGFGLSEIHFSFAGLTKTSVPQPLTDHPRLPDLYNDLRKMDHLSMNLVIPLLHGCFSAVFLYSPFLILVRGNGTIP